MGLCPLIMYKLKIHLKKCVDWLSCYDGHQKGYYNFPDALPLEQTITYSKIQHFLPSIWAKGMHLKYQALAS